ncbi:hypothetical protein [Oribacterium sp. C9]|nr:hypothetical protein [Oribacterium sp. C9]
MNTYKDVETIVPSGTDLDKIVDGLDLFDDDLMTLVFTDKIPM